jgi:hypothetical protein
MSTIRTEKWCEKYKEYGGKAKVGRLVGGAKSTIRAKSRTGCKVEVSGEIGGAKRTRAMKHLIERAITAANPGLPKLEGP